MKHKTADQATRRERMQQRAREHLGLEISKAARQRLIRMVQRGETKFARKVTGSRTVVVADHEGREVAFLYCSRSKSILTFLPRDAQETAAWRQAQHV